jgi:hypothetical protein
MIFFLESVPPFSWFSILSRRWRRELARPLAVEGRTLAAVHDALVEELAIQAVERLLSRVQLPKDHPVRVHVGKVVVRERVGNLRRHVS